MEEELRRRDEILCPAIIVKIRYPIRGDINYVSIINTEANTSMEVSVSPKGVVDTVLEHIPHFINNNIVKIDIDSVHGGQNWIDLEEKINSMGWKNVIVINGPTEFKKKLIKKVSRDGYHPGD